MEFRQTNSFLNVAKHNDKNDEFYTAYETIESELKYYKNHFRDKVILCNCDDPIESNFSKYFLKNFNRLGLKRLITISYADSKVSRKSYNLYDNEGEILKNGKAYIMNITRVPRHITSKSDDKELIYWLQKGKSIIKLNYDGDFRNPESINILKKADIIVTNPPFSLFRELIYLLVEYNKNFLLIGNSNALMYKEIFPLIKTNKVWLGKNYGDMAFKVPDDSEERKTRFWIDESGQKWRSLGNAMWLTNLDLERRHRDIPLIKSYNPEDYPKYDYYEAIEVSRVANIPFDYDGIMGVPVTFLNKHNPEQFEIIGEANHGSDNEFDLFKPTIKGKELYKRILIRRL